MSCLESSSEDRWHPAPGADRWALQSEESAWKFKFSPAAGPASDLALWEGLRGR